MRYVAASDDSLATGASAGGQNLSVDPGGFGGRPTTRLRRLCAELDRCQAAIDRLSPDGPADGDLDAAWDAWWTIVEAITLTPAATPQALQSKARAVRLVMAAVGKDRSPEASALLASLLADLLGEAVELP
jgi:hypothetical protein